MENAEVFINTFIKRQKQTFFTRQQEKGSLKLFNYMFQVSTDNTIDFPPLSIYILFCRLQLFIKSVFQSTSLLNHFCCNERCWNRTIAGIMIPSRHDFLWAFSPLREPTSSSRYFWRILDSKMT